MYGELQHWLSRLDGWSDPDAYSTAWVALVPDLHDARSPAWPQALDFLRTHQLDDGGWGAAHSYYAHERTISTLAAIKALHTWQTKPDDWARIERGLRALRHYAADLANEPEEPIGYEMLLPRLRSDLEPVFGTSLPLDIWASYDSLFRTKLAMLDSIHPEADAPHAWWFSMEMLPDEHLAYLDNSLLDANGSIATATAATAAYLAARRRAGGDSPAAARYLAGALLRGDGGVPFSWPFEVFERVWVLDSLRRAGFDPNTPAIAAQIKAVRRSWMLNQKGLSYSDQFAVNDGDDTTVGFALLAWAGIPVSDKPLLDFWNGEYFRSYMDERNPSVSANIHALTALRMQPGWPHRDLAVRVTDWLVDAIDRQPLLADKWHYSPYYSTAHAIAALAGWHDVVARRCVDTLLEHQHEDGGWGGQGHSTPEETAHCVLGLCEAYRQDLMPDPLPLMRAAGYLCGDMSWPPQQQLWIGKTLFRPGNIVSVTVRAAQAALEGLMIPAQLPRRFATKPLTARRALPVAQFARTHRGLLRG